MEIDLLKDNLHFIFFYFFLERNNNLHLAAKTRTFMPNDVSVIKGNK